MSKVAVLGVSISAKAESKSDRTCWCEYRRCDRCGVEFRTYFRSAKILEEAIGEIAQKLGRNGTEDLCHSCMSPSQGEQAVLSLAVEEG